MPFLNPNFNYDHIVSHHGHSHLFFQKFIEFFENITHCHLTSPGAVWFCFSQGRFFQGKTYLGVPYWFSQNFLQKFFRIFLKKSHLGLKRNIMKEKSGKKLKIIFFKKKTQIFSFGLPREVFSGKGVPKEKIWDFYFKFFFSKFSKKNLLYKPYIPKLLIKIFFFLKFFFYIFSFSPPR